MQQGVGRAFGTDAARYDRARPSYPDALIDAVVGLGGTAPRIVEVGCGTGIATRMFVRRGAKVTSIDPDARMLAVAAASVPAGSVEFVCSAFEDWDPGREAATFDVVAAPQSWHWVEPASGYARVVEALRPGGHLAMFWNRPAPEGFEHRAAIREVYEDLAPHLISGGGEPIRGLQDLEQQTVPAEFEPALRQDHPWSVRLTTSQYLDLLGTHSDHITLDPGVRASVFDRLEALIDRQGGTIETRYVAVLITARVRQTPDGRVAG